MDTRAAYTELIKTKGVAELLEVSPSYWKSHKAKILKDQDWPSVEAMEARLLKAGYKVVQEKLWKN